MPPLLYFATHKNPVAPHGTESNNSLQRLRYGSLIFADMFWLSKNRFAHLRNSTLLRLCTYSIFLVLVSFLYWSRFLFAAKGGAACCFFAISL